jgi:hypothetical protein
VTDRGSRASAGVARVRAVAAAMSIEVFTTVSILSESLVLPAANEGQGLRSVEGVVRVRGHSVACSAARSRWSNRHKAMRRRRYAVERDTLRQVGPLIDPPLRGDSGGGEREASDGREQYAFHFSRFLSVRVGMIAGHAQHVDERWPQPSGRGLPIGEPQGGTECPTM